MATSWTPGHTDLEFGRIGRGYVVRLPNMAPDEGGNAKNQANAYLEDAQDGKRVFMWVNAYEADFAMSGTTAQSKKRREFFPHNFAQPTLNITGQTPNQYQHARLAEFIRRHQKLSAISDKHVLNLKITGGGEHTAQETVKGIRDPVDLVGYINTAQRTAEVGVNAPDFTFGFVILKANKFIGLQDQVVRTVKFKDILDVIQHPGSHFEFQGGGIPTTGGNGNGSHPQNGGESGPGSTPPTP
jgi:hypothetical protein